MPSVDRAGRYFPLTVAAVGKVAGFAVDAAAEAWLDRCQNAGLAALQQDAGPDDVRAMAGIPDLSSRDGSDQQPEWWTDGSPHVPASRMTSSDLPVAEVYAAMLGTSSAVEQLVEVHQPINPLE
jgi:hypothetical protein